MKKISNKELKEYIQSGHINLLVGSGCSRDYLSTLQDIEERMNEEITREKAQKDYYKLLKKSKAILDHSFKLNTSEKTKLEKTKQNYDAFLGFWAETLSKRSLHIVNKQVNIFTTNFDMFIEDSCERLSIPYNDGFTGQINPVFSIANYNKIQRYKSLQFDNTSDIPLFNIVKLHGSTSWGMTESYITYSDGSHIPDDLHDKNGEDFSGGYSKIAVINPNAEKHFETVLDTNYAAMLRKFTLELEKENSLLILIGFSMADKHIKDLLYGVMKSNPTLIVVYFSYSEYDEAIDKLGEKKNSNLYIVSPEAKFSFDKATDYLSEIFVGSDEAKDYECEDKI
ncbi:MAG: SIR2 family protein [Candidatus Uhrbacteria bacterium]|nr:SIR2 family protein [Patescibacteria group bacterium]MBU1907237.1 SIR2 family protein [Patescibacteria group bacterium]